MGTSLLNDEVGHTTSLGHEGITDILIKTLQNTELCGMWNLGQRSLLPRSDGSIEMCICTSLPFFKISSLWLTSHIYWTFSRYRVLNTMMTLLTEQSASLPKSDMSSLNIQTAYPEWAKFKHVSIKIYIPQLQTDYRKAIHMLTPKFRQGCWSTFLYRFWMLVCEITILVNHVDFPFFFFFFSKIRDFSPAVLTEMLLPEQCIDIQPRSKGRTRELEIWSCWSPSEQQQQQQK